MVLIFFLLLFCSQHTKATVVLNSSLGMRQACPAERMTYTCTVNQGFLLRWVVEPFLSGSTGIEFRSTGTTRRSFDCSGVAAVQCVTFDFVATLTNTSNPTVVMSTTLADMTSTLTFTAAARLNGTMVQCIGSTVDGTPMNSSILNVAGLPSPPHTLSSTVQQYGEDNVTLTVQWQPPQYDGGAPVNYTITVSPGLSPVTTSGTSVPVTVPYNVIHTVSIVATNCNGSSSAAMLSIPAVASDVCEEPTPTSGVTVLQPHNTTVSSVIFYQCQRPGFTPSQPSSVCVGNGTWSPDPTQVICMMISTTTTTTLPTSTSPAVSCGRPITSDNSSIETYQSTLEGAEIYFRCNPGFIPAGRMTAVCGADGRWNPDPVSLGCTASAIVCGATSFASGVIVEPFGSTTVGSEIHYQCQTGIVPEERMTLLCGEDGRWNPDPQSLCTDNNLSTTAVIAITAFICVLVAFIVGIVCGALLTVCIIRWNKKGCSQKFELKENVAYGPVKRDQKIELEQNVAYGPVKRDQKIELEENVAYGPVKRDQKIELEENVAYGPVKRDQKIELEENVVYGPVKRDQKIELEENVAYGPVKRDQKIELEENVAYGPVKRDRKIELKENVAYGPVKRDQKIELEENVAYGPVKLN